MAGIQQPLSSTRLGELLVQRGVINASQLKWALEQQANLNKSSQKKFRLGEILVFSKLITAQQLAEFLRVLRPRSEKETSELEAWKARSSIITSIKYKQSAGSESNDDFNENSISKLAQKLKGFFSKK